LARRGGRGRSRKRGNKNQNSQQKQQQQQQPKKSRVFDPEKHFMPPPVPQREYQPDPISGEPISNILTAITDPESGRPANFDSVVQRIEAQEEIAENERIIYVGKGAFGVLVEQKGQRPRYFIRKRIQIEDEYETYEWRKELSPGISRDYRPQPQPLSELYNEAEATVSDSGFGKANPSIYLPKTD
jgi:hypothetical protein